MAARKIVIDCDPGQDDAIAILMALASPDRLEVAAITTVAGNVPLALTEKNARALVELAGRDDVPVHIGCSRPMLRPLETAEYVHGETGLNGANLAEPRIAPAPGHAVDAILGILAREPEGSVTLVPTGPLTNVALAMVKAPEVMARAAQIVLMGGAVDLGNVTPAAEFNIYVDPHAAHVVFGFGLPITMFGLDVTHKVTVTDARLEAIRAIDTPAGRAAYGMLEFYNRYDRQRYDTEGGPLHDPCTIAWLLEPALFEGRDCFVEIDTTSPTCIGRTVVDWWRRSDHPPNATVMREADADGFFRLLNDCLKRL
ncbi:MAG: nucleoside hydrolase [Geminicoccaceae bacterium]|nr:nucleoside hydrolase [Geminicoccaceae bacterium]